MIAAIREHDVSDVLSPADVTSYLASAGWTIEESHSGPGSLWRAPFEGDRVELLVPTDRRIKDYFSRMREVVPTISVVEHRPEEAVLSDIQTAGADVLRVALRKGSARDGSVTFERGGPIHSGLREAVLAGACAEIEPKARYGSSKPQQACDFVQNLRLGQSELGSYVIRVISPVSPQLGRGQLDLFGDGPEPPYERRALTRLAVALAALNAIADEAVATSTVDRLDDAVRKGVSANLCAALAEIGGTPQAGDELAMGFTWARSRPADPEAIREVVFAADRLPVIAEIGRVLAASAPPEDVELRGVVVQLKADDPRAPLTILAFVGGKPHRVQIILDEESHRRAIEAYTSRAEVVCRGQLTRDGGNWSLARPHGFEILTED